MFYIKNVVKQSHPNLEGLLKQISKYNKLYSTTLVRMLEWDFYLKSKLQKYT